MFFRVIGSRVYNESNFARGAFNPLYFLRERKTEDGHIIHTILTTHQGSAI